MTHIERMQSVLERVRSATAKGDDEGAHKSEDELMQLLLEACESGDLGPLAQQLAAPCRESLNLDFGRWYS